MNYLEAIKQLVEFDNSLCPSLIFVVEKEDGTVDGQIQTGIPTHPLLPVNNSNVCESDLLEVMEAIASPIVPVLFDYVPSAEYSSIWG